MIHTQILSIILPVLAPSDRKSYIIESMAQYDVTKVSSGNLFQFLLKNLIMKK